MSFTATVSVHCHRANQTNPRWQYASRPFVVRCEHCASLRLTSNAKPDLDFYRNPMATQVVALSNPNPLIHNSPNMAHLRYFYHTCMIEV
jgi:hypothetical protein